MNRRIEKKVGRKILEILGDKLSFIVFGQTRELDKRWGGYLISLSCGAPALGGTPVCGEVRDRMTVCCALHRCDTSSLNTGKRLIDYARKITPLKQVL